MIKKFLFLTLFLFSGCRWFSNADTPFLSMMKYKVQPGTPIFQKGFSNGCESILYGRSTGLYRDRYSGYKYDPELIDNPEYKFGFSRGWTSCFNHTVSGRHTLGGSADTYIYGNQGVGINMGKGNINDTVNYETGSWSNTFGFNDGGIDAIWGVVQNGKGGQGTVFGGHPLWGTWQTNQIFGQ